MILAHSRLLARKILEEKINEGDVTRHTQAKLIEYG